MKCYPSSRRACALPLLALFLAATALAEPAPRIDDAAAAISPTAVTSRFARTAARLQHADPALRAQFAATALDHLAKAYLAEAAIAREQAGAADAPADLVNWAGAVEQYVRRFALLQEEIAAGSHVTFAVSKDRALGVTVEGLTVILTHPRSAEQGALEQSVLGAFCRRHDCDRLTGRVAGAEPVPLSAGGVQPDWTFSGEGAVCESAGLEVHFSRTVDLAGARNTCTQFIREVRTLVLEIRWQRRHGVVIDWDALRLLSNPGRPEHTVPLNEAGDTVLATLPIMHRSEGLLQAVLPWIRARVGGDATVAVALRARDFGWDNG